MNNQLKLKAGKYTFNDSTGKVLNPYFYHFVKLEHPIFVSKTHVAIGFATVPKRSGHTGTIISNDIHFLLVSKVKKDGSLYTKSSFVHIRERSNSNPKLSYDGLKNFNELFILSKEYKQFLELQIAIGKGLYAEYKSYLPDFYLNDISVKTYLAIKNKEEYRKEEARIFAHNRMMEVYTKFLGNDPIIGLDSFVPKSDKDKQTFSEEDIINQKYEVQKLREKIINAVKYEVDWVDHKALQEAQNTLFLMLQSNSNK
jgi:hypothetical protein